MIDHAHAWQGVESAGRTWESSMASADVELARRFVAVWNTRDIAAMVACTEVQSSFAAVGGADYHGHEGRRPRGRVG
jgi:hypothetical protein